MTERNTAMDNEQLTTKQFVTDLTTQLLSLLDVLGKMGYIVGAPLEPSNSATYYYKGRATQAIDVMRSMARDLASIVQEIQDDVGSH